MRYRVQALLAPATPHARTIAPSSASSQPETVLVGVPASNSVRPRRSASQAQPRRRTLPAPADILPPKGGASPKPRLLIQIVAPGEDLEKPLKDKHWKTSPATRMTELLHAADVPLGLIANGEHWKEVSERRSSRVPRQTKSHASWNIRQTNEGQTPQDL